MSLGAADGLEGAVDGVLMSRDGLRLSSWHVEGAHGDPAVVLIHGLADHCRSLPYLRLGASLRAAGFSVFAFDRRGSGRSDGLANYARSWSEIRDDLARFVDFVEDRCGRLPFLVGLSFGGLQALEFAIESPESVPACVALAPALDVDGTSIWVRRLLPILVSVAPRLGVDPGLEDEALTRDPVVARAYRNDPLWHSKTTPSLAVEALAAISRVRAEAGRLKAPLLVIHGTADRVVPIHGTRSTFKHFGSEDKTFLEIPGAYHALPIEPEGDEVCRHVVDWLRVRTQGSA